MGKNAKRRLQAIAGGKASGVLKQLAPPDIHEPHVELGGFVKSADVIPLIPPLPEGVVDAGWLCAFTVQVGLGKFGGLAFPSLEGKDVCVGFVVLTSENISGEMLSWWFKKIEDRLRSQVAVRFANIYPTLDTILTLPTK